MAKIRHVLPRTVSWNGPNLREVFLDSLVKKFQWSVGIEVGVRFGRVLFYLLDNNPGLKMYAVDIDCKQFYNQEIQQKYGSRIIVLEGNSWDQAQYIKNTVDFVFIDASHSQKNVVKDITAYKPLLGDSTGLMGHDVDFPAVQAALSQCNITYDVGPDNVWIQR